MTLTARLSPEGCLSNAIDRAMNTFAASAACRTFLGVSTEAAAKAKMHGSALDLPAAGADEHSKADVLANLRPLIQFWHDDNAFRLRRDASQGFVASGTLVVNFEQTIDSGSDQTAFNVERDFVNDIGQIMLEVMQVVEVYDKIAIDKAVMELAPYRVEENMVEDLGDYMGCLWRVEFGVA